MSKTKIGLSVFLIIVLALSGFYYTNFFKTKSLANDVLNDIDLDNVNANFIFDENDDKFYYFDKTAKDSIELVKVLKKVKLKKSLKKYDSDYVVSISGDGGKFQLYISDKGYIFFDKDLRECYKVINNKDFDNLLNIIKSKAH